MRWPLSRIAAIILLLAAFGTIYLPDLGHGFIRDDFRWIHVARVSSLADLPHLLTVEVGFYRPATLVTFTADYALFGLHPLPFALTNLALLLASAALSVPLSRRLGLTTTGAMTVAAVWCFGFHGVNMAVLWISGRTALLLTLFALLTAIAILDGRRWRAAGWCLLALLSKEEAVLLPFFLVAWMYVDSSPTSSRRGIAHTAWPLFAVLVGYLALRINSGAFWPQDAPPYYQFTFDPLRVARNAAEYVHRSALAAVVVSVIAMVVAGVRPAFDPGEQRILRFAALWWLATMAITVFIPARSDLYALPPSLGPALAAAVVVQACGRRRPQRTRWALIACLALLVALLPVYRARNRRWVEPADLSARLLADPAAMASANQDDVAKAFGGLQADAVALASPPAH